jgi:hypothetical protein
LTAESDLPSEPMLKKQIAQFVRQLPAGRRALALVWDAAGLWTAAWGALLVVQGLLPAAQALLLRTLVNRMVTPRGWETHPLWASLPSG